MPARLRSTLVGILGFRGSSSDPVTTFEHRYMAIRWADHPLYQRVHRELARLESAHGPLRVLDVGGRRSNYTIGLRSRIMITDVRRETETQCSLDLGMTAASWLALQQKRSNIADMTYDDMTRTSLPLGVYDVVVAVEVLEHVEDDEAFVRNVARVLKPSGTFLMTTPNGDFLKTPYPDHKRHYRREQLAELLERHFTNVEVAYCVNHGPLIRAGVMAPKLLRVLVSPVTLGLSYALEQRGIGGRGPHGKRHLIARARTQPNR